MDILTITQKPYPIKSVALNLDVNLNSFSANHTKWSNTLKQFVNCLTIFGGWCLKGQKSFLSLFHTLSKSKRKRLQKRYIFFQN